MAQQLHLAHSDRFAGAFLLAGPPYQCAGGSLDTALARCTKATDTPPDVAALAARVVERAGKGELAPLDGLAGDRVLVAHGTQDTLVGEPVARAAHDLYAALPDAASIRLAWDGGGAFAHVWPTAGEGGDCGTTAPPYQAACGLDLAGTAMRSLFGEPAEPVADAATGTLHRYRTPTGKDGATGQLDDTLYVYQPSACTGAQACGLAIAFHGCEQSASAVGETFVRDAGFNRWADALGVVVLYPQVKASYVPLNPKGCWDWWGYTGERYDTREGVQLQAVMRAAEALGLPPAVARAPDTPPPVERTSDTPPPVEQAADTPPPAARTPDTPPPVARTLDTPPPVARTLDTPPPVARTLDTPPPVEQATDAPAPVARTLDTPPPVERALARSRD